MREMSNYISRLISKITDTKTKAVVKNELDDHYLELVDYYMDIGYERAQAESMADERLGDTPELVGEQISVINSKGTLKIMKIISAVLTLLSFLWCLIFLITDDDINLFAIRTSVILTLMFFSNMLLSLRYKSVFFSVSGLFQLLIMLGYTLINRCQLTLMLAEIFTGRLFKLIEYSNLYWVYSDSFFIKALAIAFISFFLIIDLCLVFYIIRFHRLKCGKRLTLLSVRIRALIRISFVFVLVFYSVLFIKFESSEPNEPMLDRIEVYESNTPLDNEALLEYCKSSDYIGDVENYFYIHFGLFASYPDTHIDGNFYNDEIETAENRFDSFAGYKTYNISADYSQYYEYAYVIPKYYDEDTDISKVICVKKGENSECVISCYDDYYVYKITFN